jgi:hypothetical protein
MVAALKNVVVLGGSYVGLVCSEFRSLEEVTELTNGEGSGQGVDHDSP